MYNVNTLQGIYKFSSLKNTRIIPQTNRKASIMLLYFVFGFFVNVFSQNLPLNNWQDMSTGEFSELDLNKVIAILPVGSIEQHGPHLPVATDLYANKAVIDRMQEKLDENLPVSVLPMMPVGKANEHSAFPGTLSLEPETLSKLLTEIAQSVYRAGIRKLVLYNSHGGQPQIMDIVARDLRVRLGMLVVVVNQWSLYPTDLFSEDEMYFGVHGGGVETSVMLHIRPDLVDMSKAKNFRSLMADLLKGYKHLSFTGPTRIAWQAQDLNQAGVVGNALDADADRGAQIIEYASDQLISILEEVNRYPLSNLKTGPISKTKDE